MLASLGMFCDELAFWLCESRPELREQDYQRERVSAEEREREHGKRNEEESELGTLRRSRDSLVKHAREAERGKRRSQNARRITLFLFQEGDRARRDVTDTVQTSALTLGKRGLGHLTRQLASLNLKKRLTPSEYSRVLLAKCSLQRIRGSESAQKSLLLYSECYPS